MNIPNWAWYIIGGIVALVVLAIASEYLDAATALLPGGGEG